MDERSIIMQLDRDFCEAFQVGGGKSWASYFWDDGFMVTPSDYENIIGKGKIEIEMEKVFQMEQLSFTWEPKFAEVSSDGTLGVTMGQYVRTFVKNGEEITQKGKYTTIWKKKDGIWKILFDTGN